MGSTACAMKKAFSRPCPIFPLYFRCNMVYNMGMKKWFVCVCVILAVALAAAPVALAEEAHYVVPQGTDIYFEHFDFDEDTGATSRSAFLLPAGFTVQFNGFTSGNNKAKVFFGGLNGYISATDWAKMSANASTTAIALPSIEVKVDDLTVYRFVDDGRKEVAIAGGQKLYYLGNYTHVNGVRYYATRMEGDTSFVYYALVSHANEAEIEQVLHPTTNVVEVVEPTAEVEKNETKQFGWVRFVLILGIVVPLITILFMIIKPKAAKRRQHREIYDGDDDYDGIDEV